MISYLRCDHGSEFNLKQPELFSMTTFSTMPFIALVANLLRSKLQWLWPVIFSFFHCNFTFFTIFSLESNYFDLAFIIHYWSHWKIANIFSWNFSDTLSFSIFLVQWLPLVIASNFLLPEFSLQLKKYDKYIRNLILPNYIDVNFQKIWIYKFNKWINLANLCKQ